MDWSEKRILELMLESGRRSLELFQKAKVELKSDQSLVTEADVAIEELMTRSLARPDQNIFLVGEETSAHMPEADIQKAFEAEMYIVDPIDGTANYANGLSLWGISLGYALHGQLLHGAIYLPIFNEIFMTRSEHEVIRYQVHNHKVISEEKVDFQAGLGEKSGMIAVTQAIAKKGSIKASNPIHTLACAVYPLVKILTGSYYGYIGCLKLWDCAGALPMIKRAGIQSRLWDGRELTCEISEDFYHLKESHQRRWSLKDYVFFKQNDQQPFQENFKI